MVCVVLLHICGYVYDTYHGMDIPGSVKTIYMLIESIAYPSIHIFILISSWFMLEKTPDAKSIIKVYVEMWIIAAVGLVGAYIMQLPISRMHIVQCFLPFSARAYWFVSDTYCWLRCRKV